MSKFSSIQDSTISKYSLTERKSSKPTVDQYESGFQKDYRLEKQYLQKLKSQRIKAEKLYEEYNNAIKQLKRERDNTTKLQQQIEQLKRGRSMQGQRDKAELSRIREQMEDKKIQIKTLQFENLSLSNKFKQHASQIEQFTFIKIEQEELRSRIEQLSQKLYESQNQLSKKENSFKHDLSRLKEKNAQLEKQKQLVAKEVKSQRDARLKLEQQKIKSQQLMNNRLNTFQKYIMNLEEQRQIKDTNHAKMMNEVQESNKYWMAKYQQKSKEVQQNKRYLQEQKEAFKKMKQQLQSAKLIIDHKQSIITSIQRQLTTHSQNVQEKDTEIRILKCQFEEHVRLNERQTTRLKQLQRENYQLRQVIDEYQMIMQEKKRRDVQHQQLFEDEIQEITKMQRIFKNIE